MDLGNTFFMLLLVIGIVLVAVSWVKADLKCPPPKIVYRYVPKHTLDIQFSEVDNKPSILYQNMFTSSSPWIGGFDMGNGKTYIKTESKTIA